MKKRGRKPSQYPEKIKKFRCTNAEWDEFMELLGRDSRKDFLRVVDALKLLSVEGDRNGRFTI